MKNALLIHGMPSKNEYLNPDISAQSNLHWIPWLQRQLILKDYLAQSLEFPKPFNPIYQEWLEVVKDFPLNEESLIVGHSGGAGFILRWLSETKQKVGHVVLVAPWIDTERELDTGFFNFTIDPDFKTYVDRVTLVYSRDDSEVASSVQFIKENVAIDQEKAYEDKGHFTEASLSSKKFPEFLGLL